MIHRNLEKPWLLTIFLQFPYRKTVKIYNLHDRQWANLEFILKLNIYWNEKFTLTFSVKILKIKTDVNFRKIWIFSLSFITELLIFFLA